MFKKPKPKIIMIKVRILILTELQKKNITTMLKFNTYIFFCQMHKKN